MVICLIWLLAHCERLIPEQRNLVSRLCRAKGHVIEEGKKSGNLLDVFATAHWKALFAIGRSGSCAMSGGIVGDGHQITRRFSEFIVG
jgi:hypothetical protein